MTFNNSNTYGGATTIDGGVLTLANSNAIQNSTAIVNVPNGLGFASGIGTFNIGGLSGSGSLLMTDSGGVDVALNVGANGQLNTFSGNISDTHQLGSLNLMGGLLDLSGANSYGGGTTVSAGTLQFGSTGALGAGGLRLNGGVVDLAGISPAALPSFNGLAGTIITSSSAGTAVTLTVNPTAASAFGGVLQNGAGQLSLAVNGGTVPLVLSGVNTYSGGTHVTAGTLQLGNASAWAPAA